MALSGPVPAHIAQVAAERQLGEPLQVFKMGLSDGSLFKKYNTIWVYAGGFALSGKREDRYDTVRWDQVAHLTQRITKKLVNGSYRSTVYDLEFKLDDKRMVPVIGVSTRLQTSAVEGFAPIADAMVTQCQLPGMMQTLEGGGPVDFAGLLVEPDGLRRPGLFGGKGKQLPWDQLAKVEVEAGYVKIYTRDRRRAWTSVAVSGMPNAGAFLALVRPHAAAS